MSILTCLRCLRCSRCVLAAMLGACIALAAQAEELSDAKRHDILKLQELSGAKRIGQLTTQRMLERMLEQLQRSQPALPERALQALRLELAAFIEEKFFSEGGLIDQQAPIYNEHFSHEEIRELIGFYQSPIGRKLAQEQPAMSVELMKFTESSVAQLLPQLHSRLSEALKKEGINSPQRQQ
jgi:hypothetical protein